MRNRTYTIERTPYIPDMAVGDTSHIRKHPFSANNCYDLSCNATHDFTSTLLATSFAR